MALELKVPPVGESMHEVQIGQWLKHEGDRVEKDQPLVEIETDKATLEVFAPADGQISKIVKREGEPCEVGEVIGYLDPFAQAGEDSTNAEMSKSDSTIPAPATDAKRADASAARAPSVRADGAPSETPEGPWVTPSARRALAHYGLSPRDVAPAQAGGRLREEDVRRYARQHESKAAGGAAPPSTAAPAGADTTAVPAAQPIAASFRQEEVVPMSLLRRRIAARLVEAQQTAALLTTFNEIDMTAVAELRKEHRESFQEKHGVKLGFMSFFVKAAIEGLKQFPQVNAEVRDTNIVYRNYFDIGIAVSSGRGLVVPVLRDAQRMSFAEIERAIGDFAARAEDKKLRPEELEGGTFTISNGGVFGSLLSTPIVNPPQSGVLGLHAIQDRPVARAGQVVIRPMMYVALTYDHRIVDGREAVGLLRHVKEIVEEPARMLLEV